MDRSATAEQGEGGAGATGATGATAGFEQFYAVHRGRAVRLAARLGDPTRAEDVAAEAFLRVFLRWRGIDDPAAYLWQAVRHLVIDDARRRAVAWRHAGVGSLPEQPLRRLDDDVVARGELADALTALPPRQRAAVVLRYWMDMPEAEVATTLGVTVGTVKSSAARGLGALRRSVTSRPAAA